MWHLLQAKYIKLSRSRKETFCEYSFKCCYFPLLVIVGKHKKWKHFVNMSNSHLDPVQPHIHPSNSFRGAAEILTFSRASNLCILLVGYCYTSMYIFYIMVSVFIFFLFIFCFLNTMTKNTIEV